jgi:hypothetical protein
VDGPEVVDVLKAELVSSHVLVTESDSRTAASIARTSRRKLIKISKHLPRHFLTAYRLLDVFSVLQFWVSVTA